MNYFKLNPFRNKSILRSTSVPPRSDFALVSGPVRTFVAHSDLVRRATLEERVPDVGQMVTPKYDSEETIRSGLVNPFTDPNMSALDRFETLHSLGLDALAAAESAGVGDAPAPSEPVVTPEENGAQ